MNKELKNITYQIKYENLINSIVRLRDFYDDQTSEEHPEMDTEEKIKYIQCNNAKYEALRHLLDIVNE